jgi:hypothetical protein
MTQRDLIFIILISDNKAYSSLTFFARFENISFKMHFAVKENALLKLLPV